MQHRSVTRAADHLGLTQSAVSHALARLRTALNDVLFVRSQSGLQPTARAEEMAADVRRGLLHFRNALSPTAFEPVTAERHFTVGAGAYFCTLIIPVLVEQLRLEAPGVSLRLVPLGETLVQELDHGEIDLALGTSIEAPSRIVVEPLYQEKMVWIASSSNPLLRERVPLNRIDDAKRIIVVPTRPFEIASKPDEDAPASPGEFERRAPASSRNRITVYESQTAVALVARTDLIALVPEKVAALAIAENRAMILDWISEDLSYQMVMIWHARQRADDGLGWLRARVRDAIDKSKRDGKSRGEIRLSKPMRRRE